jgi:glycosyltransferase involved in cell wall biosynthesis
MTDFRPGDAANAQRGLCILLSAYACLPNQGSEPGVGWHWATRLARAGHRVWVLTRANNREAIERALALNPVATLHFAYYDLPPWILKWKNHASLWARIYYILWQAGAYGVARRLCREIRFDVAHHITFGVFRHPSFMAFLGIPFVFGPVGGGEAAPPRLRRTFPLRGYLTDLARDLANWVASVDPLLHAVFARSSATLCKTHETLRSVPARFRDRCVVQVELGADEHSAPTGDRQREEGRFRMLYIGRLIYWKGLHLGLMAFAKLRETHPGTRLTVIGEGPDEAWLRDVARRLDLDGAVDWVRPMDHTAVMRTYLRHDAFLFPSLHDSSGNVVLEALSSGLPVVCLDAGGPAVLVDPSCGIRVRAVEPQQTVDDLARALAALADNPRLAQAMGEAARRRAREHFSWTRQVTRMEELYRTVCARPQALPNRAS